MTGPSTARARRAARARGRRRAAGRAGHPAGRARPARRPRASGSRHARARCPPRAARRRAAGDLRRRPRRRRARRLGLPARDHRRHGAHLRGRAGPGSRPSPRRTACTCGCSTSASTTTSTACPAEVRRAQGAPRLRRHPPRGRAHRRGDRAGPSRSARRSPARRSPPAPSCCSAATWASATPRPPPRWSRPALGLPAAEVVRPRHRRRRRRRCARKTELIDQALDRAGDRTDDPVETLTALGSADLAATHRLPASRPPSRASRCCSTA